VVAVVLVVMGDDALLVPISLSLFVTSIAATTGTAVVDDDDGMVVVIAMVSSSSEEETADETVSTLLPVVEISDEEEGVVVEGVLGIAEDRFEKRIEPLRPNKGLDTK